MRHAILIIYCLSLIEGGLAINYTPLLRTKIATTTFIISNSYLKAGTPIML
jgi:hypothetical protein